MSHIHDALRRAEPEPAVPGKETAPSPLASMPLFIAIRSRAPLLALVSTLAFGTSALFILLMPKKYEAEMKFLVKNERQDLVVSPESNVNTIHSGELSESQINSEIELLRSSDVLRRVAEQCRLSKPETETVLAAAATPPLRAQSQSQKNVAATSPNAHRSAVSLDRALNDLKHDLTISVIKKSDIIDVTYTSKSPGVASLVLQRLADNYLMAHLTVHANPGTFAFFDQQANAYKVRLAASEEELKQFREQNSSVGMTDQNDVLANRASDAQTALEQVDAEIADYEQRIERGNVAINSLDPRIVTQTRVVPEGQLVQSLGQTLLQLHNRRTELILKFNADDPFVQEVDKEIADTTEALRQARIQKAEENASDVNPIRQNTERDMVSSQVSLSGLTARRVALASIVGAYQQKMLKVADSSVQSEALTRQLKENEDNYLLYQKKREEARIAESLDSDRITNVAMVQAPTTPLEPSSPKTKLDLMLSAVCAVFLGLVAVLLAEFLFPKREAVAMSMAKTLSASAASTSLRSQFPEAASGIS